ncbi:Holliday junction ATP-dependent DNA helicase RuvB [Lysinibacillus sphaericus]
MYYYIVRPGLGKTTLAAVIANEMNVNVRMTSGGLPLSVQEI